jgi:hypothetical protein
MLSSICPQQSLLIQYANLGAESTNIFGYHFLSENDSERYYRDAKFREELNSEKILLSAEILPNVQDLQILKDAYGIYYDNCFSLSNINELTNFGDKKICEFNLAHLPNANLPNTELSYLKLIMYNIGHYGNNDHMLTIGYK